MNKYGVEEQRYCALVRCIGNVVLTKEEEKTLLWLAGWSDETVKM